MSKINGINSTKGISPTETILAGYLFAVNKNYMVTFLNNIKTNNDEK
jgi:hypothetical protein